MVLNIVIQFFSMPIVKSNGIFSLLKTQNFAQIEKSRQTTKTACVRDTGSLGDNLERHLTDLYHEN